MNLRRLCDVLGSILYFGKCPDCHRQHMSPNAYVLSTARGILCERCASKEAQR